MSRGRNNGPAAITLDQLIALNDEMAALVRAGVPLEQGLVELGRDMPGRLGELARSIGDRMTAGEMLLDVLASDEKAYPPVWRAVVVAGVRCGRLSAALEGMAATGRRVAEMRQIIGLSMVYPLFVLTLAWGLFLFFAAVVAPVLADAQRSLTSSPDALLGVLAWFGEGALVWAIGLPLVVLVLFAAWWRRSGTAPARGSCGAGWLPELFPSVGRVLCEGRLATFAEVLALLVQHQVPFPEALVLAGEASGDRGLGQSAAKIAERVQRGGTLDEGGMPRQMPPFLAWLITAGNHEPTLAKTLLLTADMYRQRVRRRAAWATVYLPIALTAVFGGTVVLLQGLAVFGPIWRLLYDLAQAF